MAIFILNTESVTAAAETLNSITTEVNNVLTNVNGYDTSNDDNFDFATPKSNIASNIEACKTKISNTMNAFNSVVSSHTNLQNKLNFISKDNDGELSGPGNSQQGSSKSGSGKYSSLGNYSMYNGYSGYSGYSQTPNEKLNLFLTPFFLNLITNKLFNIIDEDDLEEEIKNKTTLVIKASPTTEKGAAYIEMATKIAMEYEIPVTFIDLDKTTKDDKTPSISLVKNGKVLKTYSDYQEQETIKEMFEKNKDVLKETTDQGTDSNNNDDENNNPDSKEESKDTESDPDKKENDPEKTDDNPPYETI